jgi:hypothetical protein
MRQQTQVELQVTLERANAVLNLVVTTGTDGQSLQRAAEAALKFVEDAQALVEGEPS